MSSVADLNGMFKRVYGPEIINPLPSEGTLAKEIEFVPQAFREGENFNFPVVLSHEHGITFSNANDAYDLVAPESAISKNAQIEATSFVIRSNISYDLASKALSGRGRERDRAYVNATRFKVESLMKSGELYRELMLMYGPGASSLGANIGVINAQEVDSGGVQTFSISRESWIGGLWANMLNAFVDVYEPSGPTKRNSSGTLKVTAVDRSQCRITLTGTEGEMDNIAANDVILPRDAFQNSMNGIDVILRNTGSLFGIDAGTYPVWQCASKDVGDTTLTFDKVIEGLGDLGEMGLDEGLTLLINHRTFPDLLSDLASLRRYLGTGSKAIKQGASSIEYETQTGPVKIKVHKYMKQGEAWGLVLPKWKRVGSTDLSFGVPGSNENFFDQLGEKAGFQIRMYARQGPIGEEPAKNIRFHSIQNTADSTPS